MIKVGLCSLLLCLTFAPNNAFAGNKLIGTAAVNHIEGSAGGGLIPWAVLSGYATDDQWAASVFSSHSQVDDYSLDTLGFAVNYHDRIELSYSRLTFDIDAAATDLQMNVVGAKVRLFGDVIYSDWPQISAGVQYKKQVDFAIPKSVGAVKSSGTDFYLSATKVWLAGLANRTVLLNVNLRLSKANQIGLLGFGGDSDKNYDILVEAATGIFFNRHWLLGVEYRQKSNQLSALKEDDWFDVFITYLPNKSLSITGAYLDLGNIAGAPNQTGFYLSLQGAF
ncbi:MAG: hypothetical protein ACI8WB_006082 [Phenylobacterium sp.]|jgi:hypothetical protein